ncbi:LOW QUALITY PROTEIN: ornithine decarboxylase antizyme [Glossina fuscipes]|uniref:Ornithine decarboxylase antizyme n=1 Tax=Glossina fuscipes TaxID=7396 RepID=A0A9C6E324_9MUSC|nr:LOW QUALITY PROTEIN: ornithine decarboxylase antizyme [Glossina fuscipes]
MPSTMNNKLDPMFSSDSVRGEFGDSVLRTNSENKLRTISTSSCATNMSSESYCISLGVGPLWWSDVPTHHRTDHDRASLLTGYTRKSSVGSAGGSGLFDRNKNGGSNGGSGANSAASSDCSDGDLQSLYSDDDYREVVKQILQHEHPIRIVIKLHVTENKFTKWESVLNPVNNILYVALPEKLAPEASKETLICLLEFAEDKLEVDAVVMCIRKNRSDRVRLLESFLLMGLEPLSRKASEAIPAAEKDVENFFLIYRIEE